MSTKAKIQHKIDQKTKPLGALGILETLALQIATVQHTLTPKLENPTILVFAGDHGIASEGVSAYPQAVTHQMVLNFLAGGAAINVFCKQHQIALKIIDAGVVYDFESNPALIDAKIAKGTHSFLSQPAMTHPQLELCFEKSKALVQQIHQTGCNVIGFGEMGIGNSSSAALLMSYLCELPLAQCVGRGTGVSDAQLAGKLALLQQAKEVHGKLTKAEDVLQCVGGFEIAQMCGAMLAAFEQNMLLLVDGFIASSAFLAAYHIKPKIINNAVFCHLSNENGHQRILEYLKATPLLSLNMRLGEGTGCALAYPILQSAVAFLNEMASFEEASVSKRTEEN